MKLYITSFDNKWNIDTVEAADLRRMGRKHPNAADDLYTLYKPGVGHYGFIWHGGQIFKSIDGAQAYICKDYNTSNKEMWEGSQDE